MHRGPIRIRGCLLIALAGAGAAPALHAQQQPRLFVERDGVVAMEAEHATEAQGWEPVGRPDASGVAMRDGGPRNGAHLAFKILVERPGRYVVWFRHAKPEHATDQSNDCFVTVDGEDLRVWDGAEAHPVIGMGTHQKRLAFESRPKTHERELRRYHPFVDVHERRVLDLRVTSRSPGYLVDKIVLIHHQLGGDDVRPAVLGDLEGTGPEETVFRRRP